MLPKNVSPPLKKKNEVPFPNFFNAIFFGGNEGSDPSFRSFKDVVDLSNTQCVAY